ncbi:MAG: alcohol dehydrogenase catalytic domain-containing protein [Pseudomonadota bacterium]
MQALVYTGPRALELRDVAEPEPRPGEVLVTVERVGICGSDMHAFLGHDARRPAPLILGHEAAGTRADGGRVTINPLVTCGTCIDCLSGRANLCAERQIISMPPREGAFAGQVAMPPQNLIAVPDHVSSAQAALAEPLACGWHAVRLAAAASATPLSEARCVVYGGGAIGLGAALALAAQGAQDIWLGEPHSERAAVAAAAGPFQVFNPAVDGAGPAADSAHVIVDGVGIAATRAAASQTVRRGGVIMHIGLGSAEGGLDIRRVTLAEVTFIGTYTYTPADFAATTAAMFDGRLGRLDWIDERPLSAGPQAFADILAGNASAPKVMLAPELT